MSKNHWHRDSLTGLSQSVDLSNVNLKKQYPDCNIFCIRSFAAAAGFKSEYYFETMVLDAPDTPFHFYKIKDANGSVVTYATHTMSAQAGGTIWKILTAETHCKNLRQF